MASSGLSKPARDLKLETGSHETGEDSLHSQNAQEHGSMDKPSLERGGDATVEAVPATPPIDIAPVVEQDAAAEGDSYPDASSIAHYLRNRQPSVSFSKEIRLDSGHRQMMADALQKPTKPRPRGRSILGEMAGEKRAGVRAHSESERTQYDAVTGRQLPQYCSSPHDLARIGEGRFPLLQSTVDELARESQNHQPTTSSLTSEATISPTFDEVQTPQDDQGGFITSPLSCSDHQYASSYEEPRRRASQRWREGQQASDIFTRASSFAKSDGTRSGRLSRRGTNASTKSPHSAASSFLRAFSYGATNNTAVEEESLACDAEGQTVGDNYVIGKRIGYGGFSVIKEVTQVQSDGQKRKLAVKIVHRNIKGKSDEENEQAQAEFEHEVDLWRFLHHPRILPLIAVYKMDEATFCFIPLNTGGTLFDAVRANRQGLGDELAKEYSYQLAEALRYLHLDARVVHRDVKLENCLLDTSQGHPGDVRLCDFGMAEWIGGSDDGSDSPLARYNSSDRPPQKSMGPADTSTTAFAGGSLEYAAPEILQIAEATKHGQSSQRLVVSAAVDMWAFGVCVYCLVVGSRPFYNAYQPKTMMAILKGEWDREKLKGKGGEDVLKLVEGCLDMDPESRWNIDDVLASNWLRSVTRDSVSSENSGWRL